MPRLDHYLYENGYCRSRSLGAKLIRGGFVFVNGSECRKSSTEVLEGDVVEIRENTLTRYVSRGGLKLEKALEAFGVNPKDCICADLGASTGGFTDCLLQHGAQKVYAIDSGSEQLHPSLRENVCVVSMEGVNARFLDETSIEPVDLVVMDVSFISQKLLYPAVRKILKEDGVFLSLIKPQFEVGREWIGSGGIVRNEKARLGCIQMLAEEAEKQGFVMTAHIPSPFPGGDGNLEFLARFDRKKKRGEENHREYHQPISE